MPEAGLEHHRRRMRPQVIHCSYHKCLTVFYGRVLRRLMLMPSPRPRGYAHFNSFVDDFRAAQPDLRVASVNNHFVDPDDHPGVRFTRFIRDPRDLIVSGYHYHRRAAEAWCEVRDPTDADFATVNGTVPSALRPGETYAELLQRLPLAEGLAAEIEFRTKHFESMRQWDVSDERVLLVKYEELIGHEEQVFERLLRHSGFDPVRIRVGTRLARRLSAGGSTTTSHIRNPQPGQWAATLDENVTEAFLGRYGDVLEQYGYPVARPPRSD